jgi:predicted amidohydrolase
LRHRQRRGEFEEDLEIRTLARDLGAELVVFPECATTGYFVGDALATLADTPEGSATRQLGEIAREHGIHLACGLYTQENGVFRNSQKLFSPAGKLLGTYHQGPSLCGGANTLPSWRPSDGR